MNAGVRLHKMFRHFYFSTNGRISRQVYWLGCVLPFVALGFLFGLFVIALRLPQVTALIATLVFFWPTTAMMAKRLHDIGLSSWLSALAWVPYLGVIVWLALGIVPSMKGDNRYGPSRKVKAAEVPSAI